MLYSMLIYAAEEVIDQYPEEEREALIQTHRDFQASLSERDGFVAVQLMPSATALTLKPTAKGPPIVVDGPYAETKEKFVGIYLFKADDLAAAQATVSNMVHPFTVIEIRPIQWAGGDLDFEG